MATLQIVPLLHPIAPAYLSMVRPQHAHLLARSGTASEIIALGLEEQEKAVGLVLAQAQGDRVEVCALTIAERWRGRGLATHLLATLEEEAVRRGYRQLRVQYGTEMPGAPALERVLGKCEWPLPHRTMVFTQITTAMFAQSPWMQNWQVPPGFTVFPWAEVTGEERSRLEQIRAEVPAALWPFDQGAPSEPSGSIGLRRSGEVVGWMVMHRVAPEIVRYTALYVREPWQRAELTFSLLAEAIRRQVSACGPNVRGAIAVLAENRPMVRVLERRFRPFASHWFELREARKVLA